MATNPIYTITKTFRKIKGFYAKKRQEGTITPQKYLRAGTALIIIATIFVIGKRNSTTTQQESIKGTTSQTENKVEQSQPVPEEIFPKRIPDSPETVSVSAQAYYVINADNSKVLLEKNAEKELAPASTTKIATALTSLKSYSLNQRLKVPESCTSLEARRMGYTEGQQIIVEELLYDLLTQSAADAACTLAENYSGGSAQFVNAMNRLATNFNLQQTHFNNPTGFDGVNGDHYSTAKDLTYLAKEAMESGVFRKIVGTRSETTNELFQRVPGTTGIKTGWTEEAKGCLVFSVERYDNEIIGTLLGSEDRFADAETIINWIYQVYKWSD